MSLQVVLTIKCPFPGMPAFGETAWEASGCGVLAFVALKVGAMVVGFGAGCAVEECLSGG